MEEIMTKKRFLYAVLIAIAILCPFLHYFGVFGLFLGEGPLDKPWKIFALAVAGPCAFLAGPVGFLLMLFVFLKNRKLIIRNPLLSVGCVALLAVNFYVTLPVIREVGFRMLRNNPVPTTVQVDR